MRTEVPPQEDALQYVIDVSNEGELVGALDEVLGAIRRHSPVMLVAYVHGWRHVRESEHRPDSDKSAFREALRRVRVALLAREDKTLTPIGVYFRWRARHAREPFELICYWLTRNRADTIVQAGHVGSALEALQKHARACHTQSEVVLVGHSMGARILGRTVLKSPALLSSDLVLLMNSADDHRMARRIQEAAVSANCDGVPHPAHGIGSGPRIVWLTARTDMATRLVFPIAELKRAVGHTKPLRTHVIRRAGQADCDARLAFTFRGTRWVIASAHEHARGLRWWNVWVPAGVILGHSDSRERFRQIIQSIYHLVYDRPRLERYFEILAGGSKTASQIARQQIVYQYEDSDLKGDLLREMLLQGKTLPRHTLENCLWILRRMPSERALRIIDAVKESGGASAPLVDLEATIKRRRGA